MGAWTHLYHTRTWKQLRANHLRLHPLCVKCEESGFLTPGNTVDHVIPHNGDMDLFADPTNLQTLCAPHHSRDKQLEERKGVVPGADEAGLPLDPKHHWLSLIHI